MSIFEAPTVVLDLEARDHSAECVHGAALLPFSHMQLLETVEDEVCSLDQGRTHQTMPAEAI